MSINPKSKHINLVLWFVQFEKTAISQQAGEKGATTAMIANSAIAGGLWQSTEASDPANTGGKLTEISIAELGRFLEDRLFAARSDLQTSMLPEATIREISEIFDQIEVHVTKMAKGLLHAVDMTELKISEQQVYSLRANLSWMADLSSTLTEAADRIAKKKIAAYKELNEFDKRILERVFVSHTGKILDEIRVNGNATAVQRVPLAILELLENKELARVGVYPDYVEVSLLERGRKVLFSSGGRMARLVTHYFRALLRNVKALFVGAFLALVGQNLEAIIRTLISPFLS